MTNDAMTDAGLPDLLPCPFCGNDHIAIGYSNAGYDVSCFRGGPCCKSSTGIWPTEAEAIAAWNRRRSTPVTVGEEAPITSEPVATCWSCGQEFPANGPHDCPGKPPQPNEV